MLFAAFKQKILSTKVKTQLIMSFVCTTVAALILMSTVFYARISTSLKAQSEQSTVQHLRQLEYNIDLVLNNMETLSRQILVSAYFSDEMKIDSLDNPVQIQNINRIYTYFADLMMNDDYIDSIFYYGDNGVVIGASSTHRLFLTHQQKSNFFYASTLRERLDKSRNVQLCGIYTSYDFFGGELSTVDQTHDITLARGIQSLGRTKGYILINIKEDYLRSLYQSSNLGFDGQCYMLDQDRVVISSGDKSEIGLRSIVSQDPAEYSAKFLIAGSREENGDADSQVIYYPFKSYGLAMVYEIPYDVLFANIVTLRRLTWALAGICVGLTLVIGLFWIYKITKPLTALLEAMQTFGEGNVGIRLNENERNELGILGRQFNRMSGNIKSLIEKNRQIEEKRRDLEIQNLQNQINPHFLYNTLNTIKWMAIMHKADNIADCITALGNILKPIYSSRDVNWTISSELDYLRNYIRIMTYRTGNSIELRTDFPEDITGCVIPKFTLQPIVENAAVHSNPNSNIRTVIAIDGHRQDEFIEISVTDNGVGIMPEKLEKIRRFLRDDLEGKDEADTDGEIGIGIRNTNRRIRLQYGSPCGLDLYSEPGKGTRLAIRLKYGGPVAETKPPQPDTA